MDAGFPGWIARDVLADAARNVELAQAPRRALMFNFDWPTTVGSGAGSATPETPPCAACQSDIQKPSVQP
jgi:hypothetical protein